MKLSFRWFGPDDPVPLAYIAQIPAMRSVVTAVYDAAPGQLWPMARLEQLQAQCQAYGLVFDVVESLPVHEHIKLGGPDASALLETYCENIRRCAAVGVRCITYNFMPVFDWLRTDLAKPQPDGATALALDWQRLAAMDPTRTDLHLPGWDESYAPAELQELLVSYRRLGPQGLLENLARFCARVMPVAAQCGVRMALHPDDPPASVFGLPRIAGSRAQLDRILDLSDSPAHCLCLCTGSLGAGLGNDVPALVRRYAAAGRIAFLHIRNIGLLPGGDFEERAHPSACGSLDLYAIVRALTDCSFDGYVRPDHGRMIWGETGRPGYGLYDRALGAAYLTGLFEACEKADRAVEQN